MLENTPGFLGALIPTPAYKYANKSSKDAIKEYVEREVILVKCAVEYRFLCWISLHPYTAAGAQADLSD